jgi:zinc/manganese transport system permease protein
MTDEGSRGAILRCFNLRKRRESLLRKTPHPASAHAEATFSRRGRRGRSGTRPLLHETLIAPFAEFAFMRRALVGGAALAVAGGPIGVFLMLRRMSLTGDAMAHAILPGVAVGYLLFGLSLIPMTLGGLVAGFAVAVLAGTVARVTVLKEDASLAAFYLLSLALGVTIVSLKGSNVDLLHVLFGSVLALGDDALLLMAGIATVTLVTLALIYRPLVLDTVDPGFLRSVSGAGAPVHLVFLGLVVLNLVGAFNALGSLLAVGLMMLPAAASRFWTRDISGMILISAGLGLLASAAGLLLSYHLNLAAGPTIILVAGGFYLLSLALGREDGLLWRRR